MGLFGGSFATGLATGLATSVGETISDDRARREARLDKLRTFYETRQVQEQDRAKAEDDRTRKHLERLKREANVSAAEVVAMYKGLGGTNDALDNHFNIVDQSKALGRTFDYTDMLKNSGMDFSQYGNFTMQDAFDNFKYEISDVDVNYKEAPGFLAAIGLGQDEDKISASITEGVRGLVPSVSRKDSGIGSMAVPEGFYGQTPMAEKAKKDTMILDIKKRVVFMQDAFSDAKNALAEVEENKDNLTGEEFENALKEAASNLKTAEENLEENKNLYKWMESSKLSAEEMVSLTARRDGYRQEKNALLGEAGIDAKGDGMDTTARVMEDYKYTGPNGQEQVVKAGTKITGAAAIAYKEKKINEFDRKYTIDNLVDTEGNFIENTAKLMFKGTGGLGLIPYNTYTNVIKEMGVVDIDNETGAVVTGGGSGNGTETPVFTLEQAQEQIANLDIPSMTQEDKEAKKADIIFNATRGVKTPAEDAAVRAQLEEIFVDTGLSKGLPKSPAKTPVFTQEQQQGAIAALVETNYQSQELNDSQSTKIIKELVDKGIVPTEEEGAQALENYKVKKQYDNLSPEDRMAYNDTAFDEFITPTEEGASPLTMNEEVRILARKSATGIGRILTNQQANKIAENITDEFLKNKLFRTDAEVEGMRSSAMYNDIREKLRLKILDILPNLE